MYLGHAVLAVWILRLSAASIAEGTTADRVDGDEEDEDDDIEDGEFVPVPPDLLQDTSLA